MAKNPETNDPFHEEHHDEEARLYDRDKKARNYIPVENLPAHEQEILEQVPEVELDNEITTKKTKIGRYDLRKDHRYPNTGSEHDNFKTLSEKKKARTFREKIRDFFTIQNNEETPQHKIEQRYEAIEDDLQETKERHESMADAYYKEEQEIPTIGEEDTEEKNKAA